MPRTNLTAQSRESIQSIADRLDVTVKRLRVLLQNMELRSIDQFDVTMHDSLVKGLRYCENFAHAAEGAYYEVLKERGEYRAPSSTTKKKVVKKKKVVRKKTC